MSDTPSPSPESLWLRENWRKEVLGNYDQEWIAVHGQSVVDHATKLPELLERTAELNPLYAFVWLGGM